MSEIDQSVLDTVRALQRPGKPDLLGRIIDVFVGQTPEGVEAIIKACASGDLETVRTSAHSIKSSAAYVGATQFSTRMANIESAARDDNVPMCCELVENLEDHARQVIDELLELQDKAA